MPAFVSLLRRLGAAGLAVAVLGTLAAPAPAAAEVRILAFGDSLTAGFGLPEREGFVPRARGVAPRQRRAGRDRGQRRGLRRDHAPTASPGSAGTLTPDIDGVIVELGANDVLRGIDPRVTRRNLDGILEAIDARRLPAIVAGIPAPPNYDDARRKAFKAVLPRRRRRARRDLLRLLPRRDGAGALDPRDHAADAARRHPSEPGRRRGDRRPHRPRGARARRDRPGAVVTPR